MILRRLVERRATVGQARQFYKEPASWLEDWFGGVESDAGITVTERSAMNLMSVNACVRVRAEDIASLPCILYKRRKDGRGKDRADGERLYEILHDQPNPEMTSFSFWETGSLDLDLWGNYYALKEINGRGDTQALWPVSADRVRPYRNDAGDIRYKMRINENDPEEDFPADLVFHVPGLGWNGLLGFSRIAMARQAIGLGLATEKAGALFFGQGMSPSGILQHPGPKALSDPAYNRLKDSMEDHATLPNFKKHLILEEGMTWTQGTMPLGDAQFLESRGFQVLDICRLYRMPPHKVAHLDKATFSNIESEEQSYVTNSLRPSLVRTERTVPWKLLRPQVRGRFFAEFLVDGLLRGDPEKRHASYAIGRQWGYYTADDVLAMENRNPLPNGVGGAILMPVNMIAIKPDGSILQASSGTGKPKRSLVVRSFAPVFEEYAKRVSRREERAGKRAAKKGPGSSYETESRNFLAAALHPLIRGLLAWTYQEADSHNIRDTQADVISRQIADMHAPGVAQQAEEMGRGWLTKTLYLADLGELGGTQQ